MSRDPRILALRRELAAHIVDALGPHAQYHVAPFFGIPQPRMSELNRGVVNRHSLEWLITRIHRMGGDVALVVDLPNPKAIYEADLRAKLMAMRARR